jgi:hypothetical protein
MTLGLMVLLACAQRGSDDVDTTASLSTAWVQPLAGTIWRIGFNIVNPSAPGFGSCFSKPLSQLVHAGEDWANAAGTPVRAIGAGTVVYAAYVDYPGSVIVIRHDLSASERSALGISGSTIYSQYGHLTGLLVSVGTQVGAGQQIASVLDQASNSHLHWEIRTVEAPQLCGFNDPGPGYTDAGTDARNWGYLSPSGSLAALTGAGPATCDNNVPVGGTACNPSDPGAEFVCTYPGLPSSEQWTREACLAGQSCSGTHCQGALACPFQSIQARVQPNIQTAWTQTLTISSGQSIRLAGFYDGAGQIDTSGNTTLHLTGPQYDHFFINDTTVTLTVGGTYTLSATCGGLTDTATINVSSNVSSCPYSSIQVRVQQGLQSAWASTLTLDQGQSFRVGGFYNGTGLLAPSGIELSVSGPNGALPPPVNGAFVPADSVGTYTVTGACGSLRDSAVVTAQGTVVPDPLRFQFGIGHAWAPQWGSTLPRSSWYAFDAANLDQIVKAGATSTNLSFDWISIEPTQGVRDWSYADQQVAEVEKRGLEPFAYTGNSPTWVGRDANAQCTESFRNPPPNTTAGKAAFHDFFKTLSSRYCGRVKYYEFWNEPNGCSWMSCGCGDQTPQQKSLYAFWLGQWYQAMREGCSDVVLAVGGLDCNWGGDPNNPAPSCGRFIDQLYENGAGNSFDAVALHPYGYSGDLNVALRDNKVLNWEAIRQVSASLQNHSNANRMLWLNEWGFNTSDDQLKASLVTAALTGLRALTNVFEAQYLTVTDLPDAARSPFGLVSIVGPVANAELQPRAAWFAFRDKALGPNTTWHGPVNPGMEFQGQPPSPQFTSPIPFWAPNGAWSFHSGFPRAGNGVLGRKFGYYSAGTTERFRQILSDSFEARRRYCFRSTAQGGSDDDGVLPYQIGYIDAGGGFVALNTRTVALDGPWRGTAGVCHNVAVAAVEIGRPIVVRFGSGQDGGMSDIWFDNVRVTSVPL